jgi:O-antigen ligase
VWLGSALVLWGVAAFGGVYEWALVPLLIVAALTAAGMASRFRRADWPAIAVMTLVGGAIAVQLVPMPARFVQPTGNRALVAERYGIGTADGSRTQTLSIAPSLTARAAVSAAVLGFYGLALAAWLRSRKSGVTELARNITFIGAVMAVLAIVQKGTFNDKIYWFWTADGGVYATDNYFGPFVNRNHFAGWMILAAALAAGRLAALATAAGAEVKSDWRHRTLWLSTPEAAALVLSACALLTMLVSLVWTMSRSGIAGAAGAMLIVAVTAAVKMQGTARKVLVPLAVAGLCAAGLAWKGADALASWYGTTETLQWRFHQWRDTMAPLRDFWMTGSGLNTYGVLTLIYPQTDTTIHAAQAHNDYLQLAVEGGLLVGIPVLIAIFALIRTIVRRLRAPQDETAWWIRVGAVAGIGGLAIQEVTEFSLQIPGIALLSTVLIAIAIHSPLWPASRAVARVRVPR